MLTRITYLTVAILAAVQLLTVIPDATAQAPKAKAPADEAALKNAIEDLQKAEARLERIGGTLGGHRATAIEQIKQAQVEVRKALGFVGGQGQLKKGELDINTASMAELRSLPRVDEAIARKIQAGRPYAKKDDVLPKNVASREVYTEIEDNIVVEPNNARRLYVRSDVLTSSAQPSATRRYTSDSSSAGSSADFSTAGESCLAVMIPGVCAWTFVVWSTKPNTSRSLAKTSRRIASSPGFLDLANARHGCRPPGARVRAAESAPRRPSARAVRMGRASPRRPRTTAGSRTARPERAPASGPSSRSLSGAGSCTQDMRDEGEAASCSGGSVSRSGRSTAKTDGSSLTDDVSGGAPDRR